ncbi:type VI secretion system baseplate subunit TssE [Belnapia sp. T6]|uniref:Type VI secretion system baseplate subunit TssE n=1 Tax=Belnapia mucosa TaxID=2804532 RepID=A0ABS1V5E3_9PROT|nr:type VI secretion system baseplate subunit TssE [Belnapia mucosa]MBL6456910.1 type VI secretion system baseplate subunit TssE [Belnapia mucosa]
MSDQPRGGRIRLPLLDRLLDADPAAPVDPPITPHYAVETLRQAVRRDLESLLNARRRRVPLPAGLAALPLSPLGYGIPDPTAGSFTEDERREALAAEVEATVRRFEPRLMNVRVTLAKASRERADTLDRTLRLRVEAVLRSDPVPEQISFETHLRPVTLDVAVREN